MVWSIQTTSKSFGPLSRPRRFPNWVKPARDSQAKEVLKLLVHYQKGGRPIWRVKIIRRGPEFTALRLVRWPILIGQSDKPGSLDLFLEAKNDFHDNKI